MPKSDLSVEELKKEVLRTEEKIKQLLPLVQIDAVIRALNTPHARSDAVRRLTDMLTALHALHRKAEDRGASIHPDELKPVNDYLACQKWISKLTVQGRYLLVFVNEPSTDGIRSREEQWIASAILELAQSGKLERIQRCAECHIWFYGHRLGARFHSEECRKSNWEKTPQGQKNRRARNQRYEDENRSVAAAQKQLKRRKQHGQR